MSRSHLRGYLAVAAVAAVVVVGACGGAASDPGWMAGIADGRGLAELSIPGTHDSGANHEPYAGLAKTQELTIAEQLAAGIRYFDIRCRHVEDRFAIYHGAIDQDQSFDDVLAAMFGFLDAHPTEALIVSIKEEAMPASATRSFEATFAAYVAQAPARWYLAPTVPTLGAARGKLVLLRRFAATAAPLGIDAAPWLDDTTFTVANGDATLRVQDAYMVSDNDAKWAAITALLAEAATGDATTLFLDYTSGYQTIMALPNITSVATDIDARLDALLADPATAQDRLGVVVMDYATEARAQAIAANNPLP